MNRPHVAQAVAALTSKAQRLRASAASQPRDAARKRELADGLERLAVRAARGPAEVRRLLDPSMGQGTSADARKHAGNEIYALASQPESQGTEQNALARVRAGWERGGDQGLPIHRANLQEAAALLELAEAIHPEPFWTWTRPGLLLRLGHCTAAAEAYGSAGGANARRVPAMVAQRQAEAAGTHEPVVEHKRNLAAQIARCDANGVDQVPLIEVQSQPGELLSPTMLRLQPAPDATPGIEPPMANRPGGSCVFNSSRPVIGLWFSSVARAILAVVADHLMEGRKNRCPLFRSGWLSDLLAR